MPSNVENVTDPVRTESKARFGRVRLWFDESPPAFTTSSVLALAIFGLGWLFAIESSHAPSRVPSVSLQPVLDERGLEGTRSNTHGVVQFVADFDGLAAAELPDSVGLAQLNLTAADTSQPLTPPAADSANSAGNLAESDETMEPGWEGRNLGEPSGQASEAHDAKPPAAQSSAAGIKALAKLTQRSPSRAGDEMPGRITSDDTGDNTARFFGLGAEKTKSIVYVIDCSGSMGHPPFKLRMAKKELLRSIQALKPEQSFYVIFFSDRMFPMPGSNMMAATDANKETARQWIEGGFPHGGTNPLPAVLSGLQLQPETMYVLSDGLFKAEYLREIRSRNRGPHRASIYTVGFGDHSGEYQLQRLAHENAGSYRYVDPLGP